MQRFSLKGSFVIRGSTVLWLLATLHMYVDFNNQIDTFHLLRKQFWKSDLDVIVLWTWSYGTIIRGGRANREVVGLFCGGLCLARNFGVATPLFAITTLITNWPHQCNIVNVIYSMKKWWGYAPPLPKVVGLKPHQPHQPHLLCRPWIS